MSALVKENEAAEERLASRTYMVREGIEQDNRLGLRPSCPFFNVRSGKGERGSRRKTGISARHVPWGHLLG